MTPGPINLRSTLFKFTAKQYAPKLQGDPRCFWPAKLHFPPTPRDDGVGALMALLTAEHMRPHLKSLLMGQFLCVFVAILNGDGVNPHVDTSCRYPIFLK